MKKSVMSTAAAVVLGLFVSGCGGNTPDGAAVTYVNALAKGDIETAKSVASGYAQKELDEITRDCAKGGVEKLKTEFEEIYRTIMHGGKLEADEMLKPHMNEFIELGKTFTGGGALFVQPYDAEKKKMINERVEKLMPVAEQLFSLYGIKTENPEAMKKIFIMALPLGSFRELLDDNYLPDMALEYGITKVTPECVAEKSGMGTVDEINVIETKQGDSADQAEVRLEIINANGESKKQEFDIEKIKDEWKVK